MTTQPTQNKMIEKTDRGGAKKKTKTRRNKKKEEE